MGRLTARTAQARRQHFAGASKSDRHDHLFVCLLSRRELLAVSCLIELTLYGSTFWTQWSIRGFAGQLMMINAFAQCKQGSMVARPTRVGALTESPVALGSMLSIVWTAPTYWQSTRRWRNSMPRPGCMVETCAMVLLIVKTVLEIAEVMLTHGA